MAVEVLAPVADALIAVIAWAAEVLLGLFRSCVRSLRYAFSPSYRETEHERLKDRGPFYRAAYASWGVIAVTGCVALMGAIIYWASLPRPTPAEACAKIKMQQLAKCVQAIREALPQ